MRADSGSRARRRRRIWRRVLEKLTYVPLDVSSIYLAALPPAVYRQIYGADPDKRIQAPSNVNTPGATNLN